MEGLTGSSDGATRTRCCRYIRAGGIHAFVAIEHHQSRQFSTEFTTFHRSALVPHMARMVVCAVLGTICDCGIGLGRSRAVCISPGAGECAGILVWVIHSSQFDLTSNLPRSPAISHSFSRRSIRKFRSYRLTGTEY